VAAERTPFDSIEGAVEYIDLLRESIESTRVQVERETEIAGAAGAARRIEALQLVGYKLDRLAFHIGSSRRILTDLRTLRRLLLGERKRT
jgi:hypothetical protein